LPGTRLFLNRIPGDTGPMFDANSAVQTRSHGRLYAALSALACLVLVVFCYFYVDRPFARLMYDTLHPWWLEFTVLAAIGNLPLPTAIGVLVVSWIARLGGWQPGPLARTLILTAIATLCALEIKDALKGAFGRTWPEDSGLSYIDSGTYGFFPFHGGDDYASFPSGHMTAITTPMAIFWKRLPELRPLWAAAVILTLTGLLGADYHFVGDTIGGMFLGVAVAAATLCLAPPLARG
jgi:membrane-associated phospholipid phosphatase